MSLPQTERPAYLAYFGLDRAPFSGGGDSFFYADPEREQVLNMLRHLTQFSDDVLVVAGPEGSGKTTLLNEFIAGADEQWELCQINPQGVTDAGELFLYMAQEFGVDPRRHRSANLLDVLKSHLGGLQGKRQPILVIDDAHSLPDDALEVVVRLADLEGSQGKLIRVVLFGEPQLMGRFAAPRFASAPRPHELVLQPFDAEQTEAYILHRLDAAGFDGNTPFTPKQVARIFKLSQGWPGAINKLADAELADKMAGKKSTSLFSRVPLTAGQRAALAIALPLVAAALLFQDEINSLFTPPEPQPEPLTILSEETSSPASVESKSAFQPEAPEPEPAPPRPFSPRYNGLQENLVAPNPQAPVGQQTAQTAPVAVPLELPPGAEETLVPLPSDAFESTLASRQAEGTEVAVETAEGGPLSSPEPKVEPAAPTVAKPEAPQPPPAQNKPKTIAAPSIEAVIPDTVVGSWDQQDLVLKGQGLSSELKVRVKWADKEKELPKERVRRIDANRIGVQLTTGLTPNTWTVEVTDGQGRSSSSRFQVVAPSSVAGEASDVDGADWVRRQPPNHFTVQLLASREKKRIAEFVKEHRLSGQLAEFPIRKKKQILHALIQGSYPSRSAAEKAIAKLPAAVRAQSPWIRRFDSIQKDQPPPSPKRPTQAAKKSGSGGIKREPWLWTRDPSHFTIQLIAATDEEAILEFLESHRLAGDTAVLRTTRDGKPWYALTFGNFPTRAEAERAVSGLPAALRRSSPWIRTFASVHDDLAKATP